MAMEETTVRRQLVYTQAKQEWVAFTHTDSKVRYKSVFTGMFEVGARWRVVIGAQGKTDTVGVSAYTEWRDLFISSTHLLSVLMNKLDFQLDLPPGRQDTLPQPTPFLYTMVTRQIPGNNRPHQLLTEGTFLLWDEEFKGMFSSERCYYLLCVRRSAAAPSIALAGVKKPSFLLQLQSIFPPAAELQVLCGMSYLSEGLETDLFHSVL